MKKGKVSSKLVNFIITDFQEEEASCGAGMGWDVGRADFRFFRSLSNSLGKPGRLSGCSLVMNCYAEGKIEVFIACSREAWPPSEIDSKEGPDAPGGRN